MSKKGATQHLQTDITNDEELEKFMQKEGLLLLEVYTGWCGPCVSMISSLKKIKLEKGGEDLVLATVRADDVETFARLRHKSEPTWLLATQGKLINGMFGSNVPQLMKMISDEIDDYHLRKSQGEDATPKRMFELTEMVPCEQERYDAKKAIEDANAQLEHDTAIQRRHDYIEHVTDEIAVHSVDMGVTVLMPHTVSKDTMRIVAEHAEKLGLSVKDKRMVRMAEADLEILHFDCENPMPSFVLDALYQRDAWMVAWKNADTELETVEVMLRRLVDQLTMPQPIKGGDMSGGVPVMMPPVLKILRKEIGEQEYEAFKSAEMPEDALTRERWRSMEVRRQAAEDEKMATDAAQAKSDSVNSAATKTSMVVVDEVKVETDNEAVTVKEEVDAEADGADVLEAEEDEEKAMDSMEDGLDESTDDKNAQNEQLATEPIEDDVQPNSEEADGNESDGPKYWVEVLPIWTPKNKRTSAAMMYIYFRHLTDHFLPPDPTPDPPHLAVVFDAIKRNDIMTLLNQMPDDILAYGYFSDDPNEASQLLAASTNKYERLKKKSNSDRMVIKVAKRTSNTLLTLNSFGPTYVSLNTVEGENDCRKWFPDGYQKPFDVSDDEEEDEEHAEGDHGDDGADKVDGDGAGDPVAIEGQQNVDDTKVVAEDVDGTPPPVLDANPEIKVSPDEPIVDKET